MKTKPIDLPLEPEITGCLAHTQHVGQWCEKYLTCACHQTIALDHPSKPRHIMLRKCSDENHHCYMPVDGFDLGDDEVVAYQAEGGAA